MRAMRLLWVGWFSVAITLATTGYAEESASPSPIASTASLLEHPYHSWLTNGGNLFNQRYSPLSAINNENVNDLKGVWLTRLNGSGVGPPYSGEAQPIVHNGVMYLITGANDVFAINIDNGEQLWVYESGLDPSISTLCCGWTSRGVALGEEKIFVSRVDGKIVALDISNGEVLWSIQAEHWQAGFTITSAPLYYEGMVITGFAGAEYGVRGRVKAYDANDGSLLWTFYTIPAPGEPGHETWPKGSEIWKRGGATVWHTPAVDPELGLLYFATGNPGPDFNGSVREGDNLYSVSMVALDVKTGKYRWHFQQVHHDIWDYDASSPVVLFDAKIDGRSRKGIAHAGKTGWVYILDRETGEPLIGIEERAVPQESRQLTAKTQPYPIGDAFVPQRLDMPMYGYPYINEGKIFTPFWQDVIALKPSGFGGTTWAPPSYDPNTQTLYICGMDHPGLFTGGIIDGQKPQQQFIGGKFIFAKERAGIFAAVDLTTNKLKWQSRWDDSCYSGSTVTAGNLIFTGLNDGRFAALDSRDGSVLWDFQAGAGVNAPPAVFEHRGTQYVAVYAAGAIFAQSAPGDYLWLFALNGTLDEVEPGSASVALRDTSTNLGTGKEIYARYCSQCHGNNGEGGHGGGPALKSRKINSTRTLNVITEGTEQMPAFGAVLTYAEVKKIVAFISAGMELH